MYGSSFSPLSSRSSGVHWVSTIVSALILLESARVITTTHIAAITGHHAEHTPARWKCLCTHQSQLFQMEHTFCRHHRISLRSKCKHRNQLYLVSINSYEIMWWNLYLFQLDGSNVGHGGFIMWYNPSKCFGPSGSYRLWWQGWSGWKWYIERNFVWDSDWWVVQMGVAGW